MLPDFTRANYTQTFLINVIPTPVADAPYFVPDYGYESAEELPADEEYPFYPAVAGPFATALNFNIPQFHANIMQGNDFVMTLAPQSGYAFTGEMEAAAVATLTLSVLEGTALGASMPTAFHPNGYRFVGFNTQANGQGTWINAETVITGPVTAHAIWDTTTILPLMQISSDFGYQGTLRERVISIDTNRLNLPAGTSLTDLTVWQVVEAGLAVVVAPTPAEESLNMMHSANTTRLLVVLSDGLHHSFTGDPAHRANLYGIYQLFITP
jgi:hypothetical protein